MLIRRMQYVVASRAGQCLPRLGRPTARAFTLVEMLVAMAITLVMMAAVVTLFANVSNSVRNRRATMEMSGQIRGVRNVLQQDLQGATCPGLTWQKSESNHGYIELIEGAYREGNASNLVDADPSASPPRNWPPTPLNPEIDHATSVLPSSNLPFKDATWATDGGGLGDYDDILMLTVRNEHQPFVGRMPTGVRLNKTRDAEKFDVDDSTDAWGSASVESPLAEVVWFAVENPESDSDANRFFGEPGMRTIYRRTLLIAPWVNPYRHTDPNTGATTDTFTYNNGNFKAEPGLVRMLPTNILVEDAIAAIIAFQDRYDLSVRLEWDYNLGRWKIMANTLSDLTKRENRFGHYGYLVKSGSNPSKRIYPFPMVSVGSGYSGSTADVNFVADPEAVRPPGASNDAKAPANIVGTVAVSYTVDPLNYTQSDQSRRYSAPPFAYIDKTPSGVPATAQAMLNDDGQVVRVVHGPVPLWGARRGEDVILTDVLAFDLRVFDPAAPMFATRKLPYDSQKGLELDVVLAPSDPGWLNAYMSNDNMVSGSVGFRTSSQLNSSVVYPYVGQGAYVDMGYGYDSRYSPPNLPYPSYAPAFASSAAPWFFTPRALSDVYGNQLAPGYAVYDTWSFHYENDGVDEDVDGKIDQGTDGLDSVGRYANPTPPPAPLTVNDTRLGVDDVGERETVPPYDKPLRGVQLLIRAYERDSRAIRQVRVNQHFMPE